MLKLDEYWKAVHGLIEMSISYNKKCVEEWGGIWKQRNRLKPVVNIFKNVVDCRGIYAII